MEQSYEVVKKWNENRIRHLEHNQKKEIMELMKDQNQRIVKWGNDI